MIIGACTEGTGSHEFADKLSRFAGSQQYLDAIQDAPVVVDQWQLEKLALVELKHPIFFYTPGICKKQMGVLGAFAFDTLEEATLELLRDLPDDAVVAVIPDGPYVYARVQPLVHNLTTVS